MADRTVLIKIRAEQENLTSVQKNIKALEQSMVGLGKTGMEMTRTMKVADGTFLTTKGVIDPTTKSFVHLGSEITQVGKSSKAGISIADQYQKALMRVAIVVPMWGAFKLAINAITGAIKEGIQAYDDFERSMATVATATVATGTSMAEFSKLQKDAIKYIGDTSAKVEDVGNVMYQLGSAGLSASEIMAGFKKVMDLSIGTMSNAEQTAKVVAGAYRLFGDSLGNTLSEQEKFAVITNTIAKVFAKEQVEVDDISTALSYVSAAANQVNFEFGDLVGTIGFLNTGMLRGSKSGVYLAQGIAKAATNIDALEKATGKAFDRNKPLDFIKVLEILHEKYGEGKLDISEQNKLMELFDARGVKAIQAVLTNWNEFQIALKNSNSNITDFDTKLRETLENTVPSQLDKLKNKWKVSWIEMGENVETGLLPALKKINEELEKESSWQMWLGSIAMVLSTSNISGAIKLLKDFEQKKKQIIDDTKSQSGISGTSTTSPITPAGTEPNTEIIKAQEEDLKKYETRLKSVGASELQIEQAKLRFMKEELGWEEKIKAVQDQRIKVEEAKLKLLNQQASEFRKILSTSLADSLKSGDMSGFFDKFKEGLRNSIMDTVAESLTNQVMNITNLDTIFGNITESMKIERSIIDGSTIAAQNLYNAIVSGGKVVASSMGISSSAALGSKVSGIPSIVNPGLQTPIGQNVPIAPADYYKSQAATGKGGFNLSGAMDMFGKVAGAALLGVSLFGGGNKSSTSHAYSTAPSGGTVAATTASTTKAYVTNINMPVTFNLPESAGTDTKNLVKAMSASMTPVLEQLVKQVLEAENISSGNI